MIFKLLFTLISFTLCSLSIAAINTEYIYAQNQEVTYHLDGNDGLDGTDGVDAEPIYCPDSSERNGLDGEDGHNGEAGFNGRDAYVYYHNLADLKKITLIQNGGKGGLPGSGGLGSAGCNGGSIGEHGADGNFGKNGKYGNIFLLENDFQIQNIRNSNVVSLLDLNDGPITLGRHNWLSSLGAKKLFSSKSNISDEYFLYESTDFFDVKLKWSSHTLIDGFKDTKLAISLVPDGLRIKNYRGAVLDYKITLESNVYTIEVFTATSEVDFKNLSFGKLRNTHEELNLEIKDLITEMPGKIIKVVSKKSIINIKRLLIL